MMTVGRFCRGLPFGQRMSGQQILDLQRDIATFDRLFDTLYPRGFFVCGFYDPLRHDDCKLLMAFCNVLFLNKRWAPT